MSDHSSFNTIPNFEIKKASIEDASDILFFIKQIAEYEKLSDQVIAKVEDIKRLFFIKDPKVFCLIARHHNIPVGFAVYFFNFSTFLCKHGLYLEDLFVLTDERGKGFGKALLQNLAKIALENNCGRMEWSVLDWNAPAIEFYKSLQAKPMGEWTVFRFTEAELKALV
jgi:GNAT superfamily N-acetyltransferase